MNYHEFPMVILMGYARFEAVTKDVHACHTVIPTTRHIFFARKKSHSYENSFC